MSHTIKASHYRENLFPHSDLTKVSGPPTYADILLLKRQVSANLAVIPSSLGGGKFGHMGLALTAAAYKRSCSDTPYVRPEDPGVFETNNLTGTDLTTAKEEHDTKTRAFVEANVLERTIITELQAALDPEILSPLVDNITGLIKSSIPEIGAQLASSVHG